MPRHLSEIGTYSGATRKGFWIRRSSAGCASAIPQLDNLNVAEVDVSVVAAYSYA